MMMEFEIVAQIVRIRPQDINLTMKKAMGNTMASVDWLKGYVGYKLPIPTILGDLIIDLESGTIIEIGAGIPG